MKIICAGLNCLAHDDESGSDVPDEPLLFGKLANAPTGPGELRNPVVAERR